MPATKAEKKVIKGRDLSNIRSGVLRSLKMAQPLCEECQKQYQNAVGWQDACPHDPYISKLHVDVEVPVYAEDEEGDMVLVETKLKKKLVIEPNVVQIPLSQDINNGRGPELAREKKGYRFLDELGYAEMCQMHNCWLPASVATVWGDYCSESHARLVGAREMGENLEVLNRNKRRAQLAGVPLTG